ncbi:oxidation resistance protein 1-like [Paramacrobiotus metropolitanus]|uniref:oxidation resistance protein 1-like n=1 Tax=Paramacrobiotus metropolitanus TaxID=2943436 RepID=UPI002445FEA6|nr:oxidation resistance protein 1-like [Paramacrobiotus metropolitanus]XP_055335949.1 oxidation resistance protein 1-like [Paramacrobiotus metropolitanus]
MKMATRRASSASSSSTSTSMGSTGSPQSTPDKDEQHLPVIKSKSAPPVGTIEHLVAGSETLESISAKFDTTPSELVRINKLALRMVFPGQRIFIPDREFVKEEKEGGVHPPPTTTAPATTAARRSSSAELFKKKSSSEQIQFPGHIEPVIVADGKAGEEKIPPIDDIAETPEPEGGKLDEECYARFLKINASLIVEDVQITDAGNVSGVLLVTPNAIMFDPNVSDPLVVKNGTEKYGIIIPMENILSAAIYSEIIPKKVRKDSRAGSISYQALQGVLSLPTHLENAETMPDTPEEDEKTIDKADVVKNGEHEKTDAEEKKESEKTDGVKSPEEPAKNGAIQAERKKSGELRPEEQKNGDSGEGEKREEMSNIKEELPTISHENPEGELLKDGKADGEEERREARRLQVAHTVSAPEKETGMARVRKLSPFRSRKPSSERSSVSGGEEEQSSDGTRTKKGALAPLRKLSRTLMMGGKRPSDSDAESTLSTPGPNSSGPMDNIFQRTGSLRGTISPKIKSFVDYSSGLFNPGDNADDTVKETPSINPEEAASPLPGESFTTWQLRRGLSREDLLQHASVRRQKFGYRSLITMDDRPELFRTVEDMLPHLHVQQTAATGKPLYLCVRVGAPVNKSPKAIHGPVEAYGKKKLKPEYWFAIERDKAEKFYGFLVHWKPEAYGTEMMDPAELGFMLFDEPDEEMHEHFAKDLRGMAKEWEVIAFDEARRRAFFLDREESIPLPEMRGGKSDILTDSMCQSLVPHLPARAQGYPWHLVYSTSAHGFSLKSLYRRMQDIDAPSLFLIQDIHEHVFGAIISCGLKVAEHFYGTGESLLFTFVPEFKVYNWNGDNQYIVRGQPESIAIGSGSGTFGLWLDSDFFHGRTQECTTFDNEPLCPCGDFQVKMVEAWSFY